MQNIVSQIDTNSAYGLIIAYNLYDLYAISLCFNLLIYLLLIILRLFFFLACIYVIDLE